MKKSALAMIVSLIAAILLGYTIGYFTYTGTRTSDPVTTQANKSQPPQATEYSEQLAKLKQRIAQQAEQKQQLTKELKAKTNEVARLKQIIETSSKVQATEPKEEVIPATAYERTAFVTNLVHQFNADNASTEIIDVQCEQDFCFLTANISAGAHTNPEIASLMRFLDKKQLPAYYQTVKLLNVSKKESHSQVKLSLNM
ncbi:hypothetical protein [Kangiella shandongensis]|uniref:hypothetical protein n=1 Tax=Kangiella shandongensis TaxID=2763258 RepID=UPI001CBF40DA|nr:hypothetical protein [Kangiella shandongensis]